jgi:hypothetical protein
MTLLEELMREREQRQLAQSSGPNIVPPGRPYFVAHVPADIDECDKLRRRFYDIMPRLTYREQMAWCRAFGCSHVTYLMRRYQHRKPSLEEVIITVAWYDAGKPVERRNRHTVAAFDQLLQNIKKLNAQHSAPGPSTSPGAHAL